MARVTKHGLSPADSYGYPVTHFRAIYRFSVRFDAFIPESLIDNETISHYPRVHPDPSLALFAFSPHHLGFFQETLYDSRVCGNSHLRFTTCLNDTTNYPLSRLWRVRRSTVQESTLVRQAFPE